MSDSVSNEEPLEKTDQETTVGELREMVGQFVGERDWHRFHTPKNISMAMAIEVAELMEHFQWLEGEPSREIGNDPEKLAAVGEELADVLCYAFALANELGLEVGPIIRKKMIKNRQKYPIQEIRGRYGHNDPNPTSGQ
ncbi:MazG nucleotide pyrophosphohydrolase [Planctomycetales bacterium 10988]|nr:MazG nucleotide pyrophosphohydrolase [Planctomycetales bacterium 10988]